MIGYDCVIKYYTKQIGLIITKSKMEIMKVNLPTDFMYLEGETLKTVNKFNYMGSIIRDTGDSIGEASAVFKKT